MKEKFLKSNFKTPPLLFSLSHHNSFDRFNLTFLFQNFLIFGFKEIKDEIKTYNALRDEKEDMECIETMLLD